MAEGKAAHTAKHAGAHVATGKDALTGALNANARVAVDIVGGGSGTRRKIRFVAGTGLALTVADDAQNELVTVTPSLLETHLRYVSLELTAAQVKALRAAPFEIIAAPGAGKMIELVSAALLMDYGTAAYTSIQDLQLKLGNGAGVPVSLVVLGAGFLDQVVDCATLVQPQGSVFATKAQSENKAVVLHNIGGAELATGDSPIAVRAAYRIHVTDW